ncbi:hypothetical protein ACWD1Z_33680, partial [Streptomyces sp. NPDC002784]
PGPRPSHQVSHHHNDTNSPTDTPLTNEADQALLAPALEASVGPDVLLEISAADRPVVVRSADQGSFTTLVMPVALNTSS